MIKRREVKNHIRAALKRSKAVALLGPRQCGKTTLARELVDSASPNYFDLEDPESLARLHDPKLERIIVIYPGKQRYRVHKQVEVVPFENAVSVQKTIFP